MSAGEQTLKEYLPASWFHPRGVFKVLTRFWDRLPDVSGKLFITFTLDPKLFKDEESAFEHSRELLRRIFHKIRKGVTHEGKRYVIDAPYCVKVEFHESGWVHYHCIFLTRRFVPKEMLSELWGLGWVKVDRITNSNFHYLLKYVTKPDDMPEWVTKRKRLRVFQTTKGFLTGTNEPKTKKLKSALDDFRIKKQRASYTIAERWIRWGQMGVIRRDGKARTVRFQCSFREIFDHLVLPAALDGRYKGRGEIVLEGKGVISEWLKIQKQLLKRKS